MSAWEGSAVAAYSRPLLRDLLGTGLVASDAHAVRRGGARSDATWVGQSDARLPCETVVTIAKIALRRGVHLIVPRVSIQSDTSPQESEGETNDQPAIFGVDRIVHIPAILSFDGNAHRNHTERKC